MSAATLRPRGRGCRERPCGCGRATSAAPLRGEEARRTSATVDGDDVDSHVIIRQGRGDSAQGARGAAGAPDNPAQVGGADPHLEQRPTTGGLLGHADRIRLVDDPADEVVEGFGARAHPQASSLLAASASAVVSPSAGPSSEPGSTSAASAEELSSDSAFLALSRDAAAALSAAATSSSALCFSPAVFSEPAVSPSPVNLAQSPVTFSSAVACSLG